jgi:peptide/nickel transport system substrate-binding protein
MKSNQAWGRRIWVHILVLLMLLSACTQAAPTANSSPPEGQQQPEQTEAPTAAVQVSQEPHGRLVIGVASLRPDMAPQNMISNYDQGNALFDGLVWPKEKGELEPRLAESWKLLDDQVTWEFKLRDDVTFDNGEKFTADVVKYTIDTTLENKLRWFGRIATIKEVKVIDDTTVQIVTHAPDPLLPGRMMLFMLSPKGVEEAGSLDDYGKNPATTGPYTIAEFEPQQRLLMKYRPDSWRNGLIGADNKPLEVEWIVLPDPAARIAALRAGDIDVAMDVPYDEVAALESDGFKSTSNVEASPVVIFLDTFCEDCPFSNKLVRQAVNYAVDKEAMVQDLYLGYPAQEPGQLVGEDGVGYNVDIQAYPYDPDKARQLLSEAGYPDGFETTLEVVSQNTLAGETTGEAVAAYLADVGIQANIVPMEPNVWIGKWYGGGRDEMFMGMTNYLPLYDADFSYSWFWSGNQPAEARFMSNPEFDKLFEAQRSEMDPAKRAEILDQLAQIMHDEAPVIFLFRQARVHVMDPKVQGLEVRPDQMIYVENSWIKE